VKAAIVTCGGLCPGINTVIRELVNCLYDIYKVRNVSGIRYGFEGFYLHEIMPLTPKSVSNIHNSGGTILGSSRGGFDLDKIVESIQRNGFNQVYIIGGDGTHRGAHAICDELSKRKLHVAIACCPKTIDNDFQLIDRSFGFTTAVEEAQMAIKSAKIEAEGFKNGIGLVKLMGRQSGFIALHASQASRDVNYCLIPEVPFHLTTLLRHLKYTLPQKGNVVIVTAEGAGTHLGESGLKDKSGNPILLDIGTYLKKEIENYFKKEGIEMSMKYIDPTYMIRSVAANAHDSIYCTILAQNAVHGAMAGYTCFTVGLINNHYVYLPIPAVTTYPKVVNPKGRKWFRLLVSTGQPDFSNISNIFISLAEAVEQEIKISNSH
jgi:6-phosphofructokinase 1